MDQIDLEPGHDADDPQVPAARAPATRSIRAADIVHDVALAVLEDDPYPTYAWMRRHRPIAYVPETGRVWITTWDLCDEAGEERRGLRADQ